MRPLLAVTVLVLTTSCGGDDARPGAADAGGAPDAASGDERWATEPTPPVLTPCPPGWELGPTYAGVPTCEPWPNDTDTTCPTGEARFIDSDGCEPIGNPCPDGNFADGLPAGVIYVRAGASGGDGSLSAPFGNLGQAFAVAAADATIALSKGTHSGRAGLARSITIVGACARDTLLTAAGAFATDAIITVSGGEAHLRNLRIGEAMYYGVLVATDDATLHLRGVEIAGATSGGLVVADGAVVTATDVVVRDTQPTPSGFFGVGVQAQDGGSISLDRVVIERNREAGLRVAGTGASAVARRVSVVDTRARAANRADGVGIRIGLGAALELHESLVELSTDTGVWASDPGSVLVASDALVRRTRPRPLDTTAGNGVRVDGGARVELSRSAVIANTYSSLVLSGAFTTGLVTDVVVADTQQVGTVPSAAAVVVQYGAQLEASRGVLASNVGVGVHTTTGGASTRLTDFVISDTLAIVAPGVMNALAFGVDVTFGATLAVERVRIERTHGVAVVVGRDGASADLQDLVVDGVPRDCEGEPGCALSAIGTGVAVTIGGTATMTRFVVADARLCGVLLAAGELDLHHGAIRGSDVGVCLQSEGYDLSRLSDEVDLSDNGRNLDTTYLPVPDPGAPL